MQVFARVAGPIRSLLTLERLALNLVGKLSGIATHTRRLVDAAGGGVKVADTRKTTPLLRTLEKYAVRMGGGVNHRQGLYDAAMIKDNHRAGGGADLETVVRLSRERLSHAHRLIVEVESEAEAAAAVDGGADVLLLDNMDPPQLRRLASLYGHRVILEASGGITVETIAEYAATGVHLVSTSALVTKARWLDVGAELEVAG
jgi:nicotinate-nucleotide pyrophosphorylase (carboxylating)